MILRTATTLVEIHYILMFLHLNKKKKNPLWVLLFYGIYPVSKGTPFDMVIAICLKIYGAFGRSIDKEFQNY